MIVTILRPINQLMDNPGGGHVRSLAQVPITVADDGIVVKFPKKMRRALEDYFRPYGEEPFSIPPGGKHVRLSIDLAERKVVGMWVLQWCGREIEDED